MQKYVKTVGDERLKKVPKDLDLKPYRDEHDFDLIKRMRKALTAKGLRKGENAAALAKAVAEYETALKDQRRDAAAHRKKPARRQ
jgi:hypothetical protein